MSWEQKTVGDVLTLQRGFDITKKEQKEGEYPVVSSSGVKSYHNKFKVKGPGVVIGRKGTLGSVYLINEDFWPHDTTLWVKDFKGNNPQFLAYLLEGLSLENLDVGAANPSLNRNHVHLIKIEYPDIEIQNQISSILSAYDDFIENNLKRIKLLEQAAQNIYKEWFVHLRFPGYENTPINEGTGLPEGWGILPFSEVADFINGYAFKPRHHSKIGLPIIKIKELKNGVKQDTPRNNGDEVPSKYHFGNNTILFSWSASLDVYWWNGGDSLLNQHLFKVIPNAELNKWHFFYGLKGAVEEFRSRANGATMKHIKRSELGTVHYTKPTINFAVDFQKQIEPIRQQVLVLSKQNQKLKAARDILLPRLMNRTIEV